MDLYRREMGCEGLYSYFPLQMDESVHSQPNFFLNSQNLVPTYTLLNATRKQIKQLVKEVHTVKFN